MSLKDQRLANLLNEVKNAITFVQPDLTANLHNNGVSVSGIYVLSPTTCDHRGYGSLVKYQIEILFPVAFPNKEPIVRETGSTIPHNADYHINSDGTCCINVWEAWALSTKKISVQEYLNGPLRHFFISQHYKAENGEWPFGEEAHGKDGLLQAYSAELQCCNNEAKVKYLLRVLSKKMPKGHWLCPCGSGNLVRNCCVKKLYKLAEKVSAKDASKMLMRLNSL